MKSYTDIEQSKVLAKILPIESSDMGYNGVEDRDSRIIRYARIATTMPNMDSIPCWSLAALLDAMPPIQELCSSTDHYYRVHCMNLFSEWHKNAIDACVEMIIKLHEEELL